MNLLFSSLPIQGLKDVPKGTSTEFPVEILNFDSFMAQHLLPLLNQESLPVGVEDGSSLKIGELSDLPELEISIDESELGKNQESMMTLVYSTMFENYLTEIQEPQMDGLVESPADIEDIESNQIINWGQGTQINLPNNVKLLDNIGGDQIPDQEIIQNLTNQPLLNTFDGGQEKNMDGLSNEAPVVNSEKPGQHEQIVQDVKKDQDQPSSSGVSQPLETRGGEGAAKVAALEAQKIDSKQDSPKIDQPGLSEANAGNPNISEPASGVENLLVAQVNQFEGTPLIDTSELISKDMAAKLDDIFPNKVENNMELPPNSNGVDSFAGGSMSEGGQQSNQQPEAFFAPHDRVDPQRSNDENQNTPDQQAALSAINAPSTQESTVFSTDSILSTSGSQFAQLTENQMTEIINRIRGGISQLSQLKSSLSIQLNPEELGQIDIQVRAEENGLHIFIAADTTSTEQLLGNSLFDLKTALKNTGINLAHLSAGSMGQQGKSAMSSQQDSARQGFSSSKPVSISKQSSQQTDPQKDRIVGDYLIDYFI